MKYKILLLGGIFSIYPFFKKEGSSIKVDLKKNEDNKKLEIDKFFKNLNTLKEAAENSKQSRAAATLSNEEKEKNYEYIKTKIIPAFFQETFIDEYVKDYKEKVLNFIGKAGTQIVDYWKVDGKESYYVGKGDSFKIGANHKNTMIWKKNVDKIPDKLWKGAFKLNLIKTKDLLEYFYDYIEPGKIMAHKINLYLVNNREKVTIEKRPIVKENESLLEYDQSIKTNKDLVLDSKDHDNPFVFSIRDSLFKGHIFQIEDAEYERRQKPLNDFFIANKQKYFEDYKKALKLIINKNSSSSYNFKLLFNPNNNNPFLTAYNPRPSLAKEEMLQMKKQGEGLAPYLFRDINEDKLKEAFEKNALTQKEINQHLAQWLEKVKKVYIDAKTNEKKFEKTIEDDLQKLSHFKDYFQEIIDNPDRVLKDSQTTFNPTTYHDLMKNAFFKMWNDKDSLIRKAINKENLFNYKKFEKAFAIYLKNNILKTDLGKAFFNNYKNNILNLIKTKKKVYYVDEAKYKNLIYKFKNNQIQRDSQSYNYYQEIRNNISLKAENMLVLKKGYRKENIPQDIFKEMFFQNVSTIDGLLKSPLGQYLDLSIITVKNDWNLNWYRNNNGKHLTLTLFGSENLQKKTILGERLSLGYNTFENFKDPLGVRSISKLFEWHFVKYWISFDDPIEKWLEQIFVKFFNVNELQTQKENIKTFLNDWLTTWDAANS